MIDICILLCALCYVLYPMCDHSWFRSAIAVDPQQQIDHQPQPSTSGLALAVGATHGDSFITINSDEFYHDGSENLSEADLRPHLPRCLPCLVTPTSIPSVNEDELVLQPPQQLQPKPRVRLSVQKVLEEFPTARSLFEKFVFVTDPKVMPRWSLMFPMHCPCLQGLQTHLDPHPHDAPIRMFNWSTMSFKINSVLKCNYEEYLATHPECSMVKTQDGCTYQEPASPISFPNLQIRPFLFKNQEVCFRLLATVVLPGYKDCEHNGCNRPLGYGTDDDEPEWETGSDGDEWLGSDGGLGLPFAERGLGTKGVPMNIKTLEAHHWGALSGADKAAASEFFAKSKSGGKRGMARAQGQHLRWGYVC